MSASLYADTLQPQKVYKVNLSWNAAAANPNDPYPYNGYNMYRAVAGSGQYTQINTTLIQGLTFVDPTGSPLETYDYYATTMDTGGQESGPSNVTTVSIPFVPSPPDLGQITTK